MNSKVTVSKAGMTFMGAGRGAPWQHNGANGHFDLRPGSDHARFTNFYAVGDRAADNKFIYGYGASRVHVDNFRLRAFDIPLDLRGGIFHQIGMGDHQDSVTCMLRLDKNPPDVAGGVTGNDCHVYSVFQGITAFAEPIATIWVKDYDALVLDGQFDFIKGGSAACVYINPQTIQSSNHKIGQGYFDSSFSNGAGVQISPAVGAVVESMYLDHDLWFSTLGRALLFDGAGRITGFNAKGLQVTHMMFEAIYWNNTNALSTGNTIASSQLASVNGGFGADPVAYPVSAPTINIVAGSKFGHLYLLRNEFIRAPRWGLDKAERHIDRGAGATGTLHIHDNDFEDDVRATGVDRIIRGLAAGDKVSDNRGYLTAAHGTAVIPIGSNSVTIAHGLMRQPAASRVGFNQSGGGSGGAGELWLSTVDATNLTFRSLNTIGGNNCNLVWRVMDDVV